MGKSIRIYLAEADVAGIRHVEIVNWTGQALAFPRNRIAEIKKWPEMQRQGVYFLVGKDDLSGRDAVYVGEAEVAAERIAQQLTAKEFWSECITFTSKDENLTKSHVKYLESRLINLAVDADRYAVKNAFAPSESGLPRADRDAMDEFAENIRTLLGVLGHRLLDPVRVPFAKASAPDIASVNDELSGTARTFDEVFRIRTNDVSAEAIRNSDGLVVLEGSTASRTVAQSLSLGYRAVRDGLIASGVLIEETSACRFSKDHAFPSPSQAAAIILGYMVNGRNSWKTATGMTYADIEKAEAGAEQADSAPA